MAKAFTLFRILRISSVSSRLGCRSCWRSSWVKSPLRLPGFSEASCPGEAAKKATDQQLKKSAKELGMPDMDKSLDALADRSWARNQDIRQNIKAEKEAAKEAKTVVNKAEPEKSAKR